MHTVLSEDYINALRTLGLDISATEDEIRQAYRRVMKRLHPDLTSNKDIDRILEIQRAYECCITKLKKEKIGVTFAHNHATAFHESFTDLQNGTYLFLTVSARDALTGANKEMWVVDREDFCPRCNGTGMMTGGADEAKCTKCNGKGYIPMKWGNETMLIVCSNCAGSGFIGRKACNLCKGRGRVMLKRPIRIHLPRGIKDGMVLKLPGQGPWVPKRYARDAVFVEVRVEFPEGWRLEGNHLHATLDVDIWTALQGGTVPFQTLEGRWIQVSIPAHSGRHEQNTVEIPGHGWVNELGQRGNLLLTYRLIFPPSPPSETAKRMLWLLKEIWPVHQRPCLPP